MNTKFSNSLLFATFTLDGIDNDTINLVPLITQIVSFSRIGTKRIGDMLENLDIKRLLIVYITDYPITPNIAILTNDSDGKFGIYTISFHDFLKDLTSKNLLLKNSTDYRDYSMNKNNIIFIFKDKSWLELKEKFLENGYSFNIPKDYDEFDCRLTPSSSQFSLMLRVFQDLIGHSIIDILESFYDNPNSDNIKADPNVKGFNDLSTNSILVFDSSPITKYIEIETEIDVLLKL